MKTNPPNKGFTLIEILTVISIISLLSSIVIAFISSAKAKGRDSAKIATAHQVSTALNLYHLDKRQMPANYVNIDGTFNPDGLGNAIAFEDQANPNNPTTNSGKAYKASMQKLVDGGYLSDIPRSTGGQPYAYYNYGPGSTAGAMFGSNLERAKETIDGLPNSCRPIPTNENYSPSNDINSDGIINIDDIYIVLEHIDQNGGHSEGDTNGDNRVNWVDYYSVKYSIRTSQGDAKYRNFCSKNYSTDYCICVNY